MAGQTDHPLRGDYSRMRPDYTVDQDYALYTPEEQDLWKRLYARQCAQVPQYACDEFIDVLGTLNFGAGIPHFEEVNEKLHKATRWTLVAVPGLLPDDVFFEHMANRRFPTSVWLRNPEEFDYIVEPDIFHDFFGHVPLLFHPVFADYLEAYGVGGVKAKGLNALDYLARLYWYTVEFGLIQTPKGLRTYGAGILSSGGELPYCIANPKPNRIAFDLMRVMQSNYKIDTFQETYFVIQSFQQLFDATAPDFTPYYEILRGLPSLAANQTIPEDRLIKV
ncbi:MAG: phenylalanine 4-monooxygenase [Betaproteobacteria bacterium]|nr:phenylalanine 4-monooxygenase [Betaproteobacteria bacterium]